MDQSSFLSALSGGLQVGQQLKHQRDSSVINRLAGQAYSAQGPERESLLAQMYQTNPGIAAQHEQSMASSDERRQRGLINAARLLVNAPEQARPGLYRSMVPGLSRYGLSELPQQYDEQTAPLIMQTAQALVRAATEAGGTVQSQKVGADGYIYNTFRDGRIVNTGVKADRQMWLRDHPGMAPELVGKDGQIMPVGYGQSQVGPGMGAVEQIGGEQVYIDPSLPAEVQSQLRATLASGGPLPAQLGTPAQARPSEAQTAAQAEAAKIQTQLQYAPEVAAAEADAIRLKKRAEAQAERDAQATGRQQDADDALELLAEAERLLPQATGGRLPALGDAAAGAFGVATEGAKANAALATLAGQLTAKMPRMEGPQSDRDVQMYKEMAGDLANANLPREVRLAALQQIRRLRQKYATGGGGQPIRIQTADDYARLPSGSTYIAPDGTKRRKK